MKPFPSLHLDPAAPGTEAGAPETKKRGDTVTDLSPETLAGIDSALAALEATGKLDTEGETTTTKDQTPKLQETAEQKAREKAESDKLSTLNSQLSTAPTFTADQQAWLDLRTAAATEEDVKKLDAEAPQFTDEQWAWLEKETSNLQPPTSNLEETAAETRKAEELSTLNSQLATDLKAAQAKVTELQNQLSTLNSQPVPAAPLHPLMLVNNPTELDAAEARFSAMETWAITHWDGAPATEASPDGKTPAQPAYTADQVRAAYARVKEQRERILPLARQALAEHISENVNAQKIYPELFEKDNPHQLQAAAVLRAAPGLRAVIPGIHTIIGDAMVGEKLRAILFSDKGDPALTAALLKADPSLKKFMPLLAGKPAAKAAPALPRKPIVPLARPAPSGGAPRATAPGKTAAASVKTHAQAANQNGEMDALTDLVKSQLPNIPVLSPTEARE